MVQVVEAEPGEGLLQAPRDLVKLAEPVMENLRHTAGGQHGTESCVKFILFQLEFGPYYIKFEWI